MRRRPLLMIAGAAAGLVLVALAALAGARTRTGTGAAPAPVGARVTRADNGRTYAMAAGGTFLLDLGGPPPDWQVQVDHPAVLARVPNVMVIRGAQGIYRAMAPGTAHLTAEPGFSVTLVVTGG